MREVLDDVRRMLARRATGSRSPRSSTPAARPRARSGRGSHSARAARWSGSVSGGCVESDVALRAEEVLAGGPPLLLRYGISDDDAFDVGLPCGGEIEVFVQPADVEELDRVEAALRSGERLSVTTTLAGDGAGHKTVRRRARPTRPPCAPTRARSSSTTPRRPVMMVFGAVDTAQALCRMAKQVGFHTIVSDARGKFATRERLPDADEVVVGWPAMAYDLHAPDEATYVVVLTHDARFDEPALGPALRSAAPVHRRAGQPAGAGRPPPAAAERRLHARTRSAASAARSASTSAPSRRPRPRCRSWPRCWPCAPTARAARSHARPAGFTRRRSRAELGGRGARADDPPGGGEPRPTQSR